MKALPRTLLAALCALSSVGCAPELLGRWRSEALPSPDGPMVVALTLSGDPLVGSFFATVYATDPTTRCATRKQGSGRWNGMSSALTVETTAGMLQRTDCLDPANNVASRRFTAEETTQFSALFSGMFVLDAAFLRLGADRSDAVVLRRE